MSHCAKHEVMFLNKWAIERLKESLLYTYNGLTFIAKNEHEKENNIQNLTLKQHASRFMLVFLQNVENVSQSKLLWDKQGK
jgi:hypothetical protein